MNSRALKRVKKRPSNAGFVHKDYFQDRGLPFLIGDVDTVIWRIIIEDGSLAIKSIDPKDFYKDPDDYDCHDKP